MILDRISNLKYYGELIPGAEAIAAAFEKNSPTDAGFEVREKGYKLKTDDKRRFEVHYHTIDLMMAKSGGEIIAVCPMESVEMAEALPDGGDGNKMNGAPCGTPVQLYAGYFCAIYPGEAHMVGGCLEGETEVSKWVVKVPCPDRFCIEVGE